MNWPKVNSKEPFERVEKRLGIKDEINDIRPSQLGAHPSSSFYSKKEGKIDLESMRAKYEKVAQKYSD